VNCAKSPFWTHYICFVVSLGSAQNLPPCLIIRCLEETLNSFRSLLPRLRCGQGRNQWRRGAQFPGAESLCGHRKVANMFISTFFNTEHLLPKDIRFEQEGAKLASCPGCHLASLLPWVWWILQQIISLPYPVTSHWWCTRGFWGLTWGLANRVL